MRSNHHITGGGDAAATAPSGLLVVAVVALAVLSVVVGCSDGADTETSDEPVASTEATTEVTEAPNEPVDDGESEPVDVLLTGNSIAWTVGYYGPPQEELPEGIASVESRALLGCGLLSHRGWAYRQRNHDGEFALPGEVCRDQPELQAQGLAAGPDVVVAMPGAWEWADMQRPDGTVIEHQSPELARALIDELVDQIGAAHDVGARFVIFAWVCPGGDAADVRAEDDYIRWINEVFVDAAAEGRERHGADVTVVDANEAMCIDADPTGEPTPEKVAATGNEVHIVDQAGARWIWDAWLAPGILG